jgi:superfamily II DNA helicase RecQ
LKLKVFTLRFSDSMEGFDDAPLQEFITDKEIIELYEHFFIHENTPCLAILIAYRSIENYGTRKTTRQPDPRNEFDSTEKEAYDALRAWRAAAAKMEGIPPYMIATNKQLAKMIKMRVNSREALGRIEGVGEAKTARYGKEILEIVAKHMTVNASEAVSMNKETGQ